jgi:hypothetical protein
MKEVIGSIPIKVKRDAGIRLCRDLKCAGIAMATTWGSDQNE